MYRVMIVDDHESMCDSLTYALENGGRYKVVYRLASASYAQVYAQRLKPDLIFMDVCTDGGASGIEETENIRKNLPEIKIIVMSGFNEITYGPRAKDAGAHAFVLKSSSLDYFIMVADGVMEGKRFFPESKSIPMPKGEAPLTKREMEVLQLMCQHMTTKEIAKELFISENTVKYHKANMLAKTGFSKGMELAFYMITNGWINPLY